MGKQSGSRKAGETSEDVVNSFALSVVDHVRAATTTITTKASLKSSESLKGK